MGRQVDSANAHTKLDLHIATCVVGLDMVLVTHNFECSVCVHGYNQSVGTTLDDKTVSTLVVYDHPTTSATPNY